MGHEGYKFVNTKVVAAYDTTILIDWFKMRNRRERIKELRQGFDWTLTTDIALLEFKAVLIQQMATIFGALSHYGRYTTARAILGEKNHPQVKLRHHIFNAILNVCLGESSFDISEEADRKAAEMARLQLRILIPKLHRDVEAIVDSVHRAIRCDRAADRPKFLTKSFAPLTPMCVRGKNKSCQIEEFVRENIVPKLAEIRALADRENLLQLQKACDILERIRDDKSMDVTSSQCRGAGDCLISFCSKEVATHNLSTNAKEWAPLSSVVGSEFLHVTYPDEHWK